MAVHVGYHKTASTWLQLDVFPRISGVRYGNPLLAWLVEHLSTSRDESLAAPLFRVAIKQMELLPGGPLLLSNEGLSGSLWDGADIGFRNAERLHRVVPGARILLVVRRQDEMLRSIHAQYVNEGGTGTLLDFLSGRCLEGCRFDPAHLEYDRLVAHYVELFGAGRVWVAPYEYLRASPARFVADCCRFLGAAPAEDVAETRANRSLSAPGLWLLRTWNRLFRPSRFNAAPLVASLGGGRAIRNLLQRRLDPHVRRLIPSTGSKSAAEMLSSLGASFARSNRRLQRFVPYSLAEWGYAFDHGEPSRSTSP